MTTPATTATGYILGKNSTATGWNGTIYVSTAYFLNGVLYEGSDERWKKFVGDLDVDLEQLKLIPKKYYQWAKDGEDGAVQIGTSAQDVFKQFPEIVSVGDDGFMSVAYDRLSIVALAAIDKLIDENNELKSRIQNLENR